ncbi:MAG TPA: GntR family transcriptional regulator [Xanthobacteraceae bacterium]|nr:GntR family transcriptional regulator [Xanthobacteraceae bacterium]
MADDRLTRTEKLAGEIADAVLDGRLPPGSRLDEQMLADRYGTSRTPVREALRQLATTGLIELRPRRGAMVTQVTSEQLEVLFVAMGEMEATCARLSSLSMTPIERRRLQAHSEAMAEMVARGDVAAYAAANTVLHTLLYAGAHNPIIAEMASGLRRRLAPFRRAQFRAPGRLPRSHAEHSIVVEAIIAGDAMAAHSAMLHHVSLVEDAFEQLAANAAADMG